ncbi:MAG: type II and III secretion system protein, partial [Verrucomicrobia bacterium]|nr:type II and III secretion system protein [Verrucomicrobiota bacterium]
TILDTITQTRTATAFLNVDQVSLFLSALEKNSNAEMISHPQIVVGNRMEAKIHVGQKYPVLPTIVIPPTQLGGQYTYTDGEKEIVDLGLTLWVIPEIDFVHNTVRLTVRPGTATKEDNVINPQTGKTYPIVASRELTTRVNVPSGHTVAIGGLMENTTSKVEKKVPILGDIPLLGLLFRHTEDVVLKNNLIILITPTILDDSKPLTGLEAVAQLTIDKYEKIPLTAVKAVPSNTVAGVTIGTNAATPAAGMGQQASASNAPAATPVPAATTPANQ